LISSTDCDEDAAMTRLTDETIGLLLGRANRHLLSRVSELCAPWGVTPQQLWLVLMLHEGDTLTASDLSARMPIDKAAASRLIDRLVGMGWVATKASQADRRRQLLTLTDKGSRAAEAIGREAERLSARITRGLSPRDVEALATALRRLIANLV
jgi:DNA-binding MarR family transcriptional regulator